jgi:hypothetical protein
MKRLIVLLAMLVGCTGVAVKPDVDICETIRNNTSIEITVLREERDWEVYFTEVGRKLAYNMKVGSDECVEVNILSAQHNQEIKGYYCVEQRDDGWYTVETLCEYTQGEATDRSIGFAKPLGPR